MGAQLRSVRDEQPTKQNQIGIQLRNIMLKIEETNNEHRSGSQRTEALENILLDIRIVIAHQTRWTIENIISNQTMGVVESRIEILD